MIWFVSIVGGLFIFIGLVIVLQSWNRRMHWPEVPGEIVGFKEHVSDDDGTKHITYIPQIKIIVKGKEYIAYTNENITWRKQDFKKKVTVYYDRDNPERMYLKDGTGIFGCVFLIFAILWLTLIISAILD